MLKIIIDLVLFVVVLVHAEMSCTSFCVAMTYSNKKRLERLSHRVYLMKRYVPLEIIIAVFQFPRAFRFILLLALHDQRQLPLHN